MRLENSNNLPQRLSAVQTTLSMEVHGQVAGLAGLTIEVNDFSVPVGALCKIKTRAHQVVDAEVIGFREGKTVMMPLSENAGMAAGDDVCCAEAQPSGWLSSA